MVEISELGLTENTKAYKSINKDIKIGVSARGAH